MIPALTAWFKKLAAALTPRQAQIPGGPFISQSGDTTKSAQVPGGPFVNGL